MKRETEQLNLRDAFPAMPAACHAALMTAACSVKEEKEMKRATFRAVLIAACIILATMAVALAATEAFGWTNFFETYHQTTIPKAAQEVMAATEPQTYEVGPATFTVQQLLADKYTAFASVKVLPKEGDALVCMSDALGDPIGANGENGEALAKKLGISAEMSWIDAAKQLNLPLYAVRASMETDEAYIGGEGMEDVLYDEDRHLIYFCMQMLAADQVKDKLPIRFDLSVSEIGANGERADQPIRQQTETELTVSPVTDSFTYVPKADYIAEGLKLNQVEAELTAAGMYLTSTWTAQQGVSEHELMSTQPTPVWMNEAGEAYPTGMNLTSEVQTDAWPEVRMINMVSADSIPSKLVLSLRQDSNEEDANAPRTELIR